VVKACGISTLKYAGRASLPTRISNWVSGVAKFEQVAANVFARDLVEIANGHTARSLRCAVGGNSFSNRMGAVLPGASWTRYTVLYQSSDSRFRRYVTREWPEAMEKERTFRQIRAILSRQYRCLSIYYPPR